MTSVPPSRRSSTTPSSPIYKGLPYFHHPADAQQQQQQQQHRPGSRLDDTLVESSITTSPTSASPSPSTPSKRSLSPHQLAALPLPPLPLSQPAARLALKTAGTSGTTTADVSKMVQHARAITDSHAWASAVSTDNAIAPGLISPLSISPKQQATPQFQSQRQQPSLSSATTTQPQSLTSPNSDFTSHASTRPSSLALQCAYVTPSAGTAASSPSSSSFSLAPTASDLQPQEAAWDDDSSALVDPSELDSAHSSAFTQAQPSSQPQQNAAPLPMSAPASPDADRDHDDDHHHNLDGNVDSGYTTASTRVVPRPAHQTAPPPLPANAPLKAKLAASASSSTTSPSDRAKELAKLELAAQQLRAEIAADEAAKLQQQQPKKKTFAAAQPDTLEFDSGLSSGPNVRPLPRHAQIDRQRQHYQEQPSQQHQQRRTRERDMGRDSSRRGSTKTNLHHHQSSHQPLSHHLMSGTEANLDIAALRQQILELSRKTNSRARQRQTHTALGTFTFDNGGEDDASGDEQVNALRRGSDATSVFINKLGVSYDLDDGQSRYDDEDEEDEDEDEFGHMSRTPTIEVTASSRHHHHYQLSSPFHPQQPLPGNRSTGGQHHQTHRRSPRESVSGRTPPTSTDSAPRRMMAGSSSGTTTNAPPSTRKADSIRSGISVASTALSTRGLEHHGGGGLNIGRPVSPYHSHEGGVFHPRTSRSGRQAHGHGIGHDNASPIITRPRNARGGGGGGTGSGRRTPTMGGGRQQTYSDSELDSDDAGGDGHDGPQQQQRRPRHHDERHDDVRSDDNDDEGTDYYPSGLRDSHSRNGGGGTTAASHYAAAHSRRAGGGGGGVGLPPPSAAAAAYHASRSQGHGTSSQASGRGGAEGSVVGEDKFIELTQKIEMLEQMIRSNAYGGGGGLNLSMPSSPPNGSLSQPQPGPRSSSNRMPSSSASASATRKSKPSTTSNPPSIHSGRSKAVGGGGLSTRTSVPVPIDTMDEDDELTDDWGASARSPPLSSLRQHHQWNLPASASASGVSEAAAVAAATRAKAAAAAGPSSSSSFGPPALRVSSSVENFNDSLRKHRQQQSLSRGHNPFPAAATAANGHGANGSPGGGGSTEEEEDQAFLERERERAGRRTSRTLGADLLPKRRNVSPAATIASAFQFNATPAIASMSSGGGQPPLGNGVGAGGELGLVVPGSGASSLIKARGAGGGFRGLFGASSHNITSHNLQQQHEGSSGIGNTTGPTVTFSDDRNSLRSSDGGGGDGSSTAASGTVLLSFSRKRTEKVVIPKAKIKQAAGRGRVYIKPIKE
ncbi:hypothetical protein V8E36_004736 [Tilletia maclaganii]